MRCLILCHVFYADIFTEQIAPQLRAIKAAGGRADLLVNGVAGAVPDDFITKLQRIPGIRSIAYTESENRGLDIGGTTRLLQGLDLCGYDAVLKLHTKKSPHAGQRGEQWMEDFLSVLLGQVAEVFELFARSPVAMVSAAKYVTQDSRFLDQRAALCHKMGVPPYLVQAPWTAGSMFWARSSIFECWRDRGPKFDEHASGYSIDGTLAHVMERCLGSLGVQHGGLHGLPLGRD